MLCFLTLSNLKIEKFLRKNLKGFWRNQSTTSQILTICLIIGGVHAKNPKATLVFVDFSKAFDSIQRDNMAQIQLVYDFPKETYSYNIL